MFCKMLQNSQENDCSCLILCYFELIPKNEGGVGGGADIILVLVKESGNSRKIIFEFESLFLQTKTASKIQASS